MHLAITHAAGRWCFYTGCAASSSHCNALQHTATFHWMIQTCNALQHTATTHYNTQRGGGAVIPGVQLLHHTATHCNTLQHTATHSEVVVLLYRERSCLIFAIEIVDTKGFSRVVLNPAAYVIPDTCPKIFLIAQVCVAARRSVLQCVAVCCSVLQCVAVPHLHHP